MFEEEFQSQPWVGKVDRCKELWLFMVFSLTFFTYKYSSPLFKGTIHHYSLPGRLSRCKLIPPVRICDYICMISFSLVGKHLYILHDLDANLSLWLT